MDFQVVVFLKVTREAGQGVGNALAPRDVGACCRSIQKNGIIMDKVSSVDVSFAVSSARLSFGLDYPKGPFQT